MNRIAFHDTRKCVNCRIGVIDVRARRVHRFKPTGANAAEWAPDDDRLAAITLTGIEPFDPSGRERPRRLARATAREFESLSWALGGKRLFVGFVPTH